MAVTLDQYIEDWRAFVAALEDQALSIGAGLGSQILADIKGRVIEKGESSDGSGFKPYSKKGVPAFLLFNKALNSAGRSFVEQKSKSKELVTWGEFRGAQGLPEDKVNYSYTGRMWANTQVRIMNVSPGVSLAVIEGGNKETQDKLGFNSDRDKNVLEPSELEIEEVRLTLDDEIQILVDRFL